MTWIAASARATVGFLESTRYSCIRRIVARSEKKRNFEAGLLTDDHGAIEALMAELDLLYLGGHCPDCGRREYCPDPIK